MGKFQTEKLCDIDQVTVRSIWQCKCLRFSHLDQTFKANKLFILWPSALFLHAHNRQENNDLQLANQSACYISYKNEPNNN